MRRLVKVGRRRLDEEQVHQSVLVVVNPGDPGPHGFQIELLVGGRGVLLEVQPGSFGNGGKRDPNPARRRRSSGFFGDRAMRRFGALGRTS